MLSVAEIRNEIFAGSTGVWQARATGRLLTRVFHDSISELFRPGPRNWLRSLTPADLADAGTLERHMYEYFIAPRLTRYQGALKESTADVLQFWSAVKEWCEWFRGIVNTGLAQGHIHYDEATATWKNAATIVEPDRHLTFELTDPEWSAPVVIHGRADALLRKPGVEEWCVVEYKAGAGAAEADLAQAVMYGLMLNAPDESAISLIQLHPKLKTVTYTSQELKTGIELLKPLIGRLAGVLPGIASVPEERAEEESGEPVPSPSSHAPELVKLAASPVGGLDQTGERIVSVCKEFGAEVTLQGPPAAGSAFIRYLLNLSEGVPARKVSSLALDLQVRLGLESSPLIRVDRGKLAVDVPRKDRQAVTFSSVRDQLPRTEVSSRVPLGVDILGSLKFADLANPISAHMLVAGTTGSGKTEWLRMAIAGLILQNTPQSLRFALIDPKGGAFTDWLTSPFLWNPKSVVSRTSESSPVQLLDLLIEEMESRYRVIEAEGVADLARLPAKAREKLPRIVCVCDEYADLVVHRAERREIESRIARLGSKARAAGIHLIIATQRPSRDIVEGTLKANLSAKVALRVNSSIESRLVLGVSGAENLLGNGDLLYQDAGTPMRLQAALLSVAERNDLFSTSSAPVPA